MYVHKPVDVDKFNGGDIVQGIVDSDQGVHDPVVLQKVKGVCAKLSLSPAHRLQRLTQGVYGAQAPGDWGTVGANLGDGVSQLVGDL